MEVHDSLFKYLMDAKKMNFCIAETREVSSLQGVECSYAQLISIIGKTNQEPCFKRNSLTSSAASRRLICHAFCSVLVLATSLWISCSSRMVLLGFAVCPERRGGPEMLLSGSMSVARFEGSSEVGSAKVVRVPVARPLRP